MYFGSRGQRLAGRVEDRKVAVTFTFLSEVCATVLFNDSNQDLIVTVNGLLHDARMFLPPLRASFDISEKKTDRAGREAVSSIVPQRLHTTRIAIDRLCSRRFCGSSEPEPNQTQARDPGRLIETFTSLPDQPLSRTSCQTKSLAFRSEGLLLLFSLFWTYDFPTV